MDLEHNDMSQPAQAPQPPEEAQRENQALTVEESCQRLTAYLEDILRDARQAQLEIDQLSPPCRTLGEAMQSFRDLAVELVSYSTRISRGHLSQALPENDSFLFSGLKTLHANLRNLTRQAQQVTKGDYTQQVTNMGEFSVAFNAMTRQLRERENRLKEEIQRAQHRAEIIQSYTEMLVDLLEQRNEWLLVVDRENQEILHCNKHASGERDCNSCQHRLSIHNNLLMWDGEERYQVWEMEEDSGSCFRIISFPIEWKERPSRVHIVMDITAEKMNARHLSDENYQDIDTGVHNRRFLDEFMGQILRERQDITMCYLDLEGVSSINALYGREIGDNYIQNFVEVVRKNFRSGDTFARVQDDKFCLVLTGNVKHLIERKMSEIRTIFQRDDDRLFSHRCSFRYSILEVEGESNQHTLDDLLEQAEADLQRQKPAPLRRSDIDGFD